jgi:hypothetical protein
VRDSVDSLIAQQFLSRLVPGFIVQYPSVRPMVNAELSTGKLYPSAFLEPTMADDEVAFAALLSPRTAASIRGQSALESKIAD